MQSQREIRAVWARWLGRVWRYLIVLVLVTVMLAVLMHFVMPDVLAPYAVGATIASGVWVGYVVWLDSSGTAHLRAGIDGEQYTVSQLRPLVRRGWRLVNHVMLEYRDVDHVLVGPGGCFAIETKFRSRWTRVPDEDVGHWAAQAARSAQDLHNRTERLQPFTPIVVTWGPHVAEVVPAPFDRAGVTICAGADLVAVVTADQAVLAETEVDGVYDALDRYLSNRSIGEERDHGPRPRPIADHIFDLLIGVLGGLVSILAIADAARIEPILVSYLVACAVLITTAAFARARWRHPRGRAICVGVMAAACLMVAAAVVVVAAALVT